MCWRRCVQKHTIYISLQGNIIKEKKTKKRKKIRVLVRCDSWVFSSRLELAVVCGVIFRNGLTVNIFLLAFKNRKILTFFFKLYPLKLLTTTELCVSIEWVSKFEAGKRKRLTLREWSRRFGSASILNFSFCTVILYYLKFFWVTAYKLQQTFCKFHAANLNVIQ